MGHSTYGYLAEREVVKASGHSESVNRGAPIWCGLLLCTALGGCSSDGFAQPRPQLIPGPGNASLELVLGAGTPLCEAYARSWAQDFSGRGEDEFRRTDVGEVRRGFDEEERRLVNNVREFVWTRDANAAYYVADWHGTAEQLAEAREEFGSRFWTEKVAAFGYRVSSIDIDNDGAVDNVFSMSEAGGFPLVVLNEGATNVDSEKTERILMHPSRRQAGWAEMRPAWPDELRTFGRPVMPWETLT